MRSTFYVTTPIYYPDAETPPLEDEMEGVSVGIPPRSAGLHVNDNPHIGHAHTTILAVAGRNRLDSRGTRNCFSRRRHMLY